MFNFLRSFIFMNVLDLRELGIISLIQTIFMFIGLLQIGLLNGGYRILSLGKTAEVEKTNNVIWSYATTLLPVGIIFALISDKFQLIEELSLPLLLISIGFGLFTLLNNWQHNALIGEQKLGEVNKINLISYSLSMLTLPLAYYFGFWGGIVVITIQPLMFVFISLLDNKELRPTKYELQWSYIKYVLSFGFIPFLSGIFAAVYTQVERWSITEALGVKALGAYFLVGLYVSLYNLVPTSLDGIFFPKAVKSYVAKQYQEFNRYLRFYYLALIGYALFIVLITVFLMKPVVGIVFPIHLPGVTFVYIVLPGLILKSLTQPIGLILNSAVILKPMLIVNALNLAFNVGMVAIFIVTDAFSLTSVASITAMSGTFYFISYIIVYFIIKKRLYPAE